MKNRNRDNIVMYFFILLQSALYLSFLVIDISGGDIGLSSRIKFLIIILCFCYVLFTIKRTGKGIFSFNYYFAGAVFFTVISDLFLLMLDYYLAGVLTFIVVQQLYSRCLDITGNVVNDYRAEDGSDHSANDKGIRNTVSNLKFYLRIGIQIAISIVIILTMKKIGIYVDGLLIATVFYFISIVTNVIRALFEAYKAKVKQLINRKNSILFAAGMVLFLLCDINVGLFNLTDFISISKQNYQLLYKVSSILMWTFYAPAQVLIALSGNRKLKGL